MLYKKIINLTETVETVKMDKTKKRLLFFVVM